MNREEIISKLSELSANHNFIYALCGISFRDFTGSLDAIKNRDVRKHLNANEYMFLLGLWVNNYEKISTITDQKAIQEEVNNIMIEVYSLMAKLHQTLIPKIENIIEEPQENFFLQSDFFIESFFYAGTGVYDVQYLKWVKEKYKNDKLWLFESLSIDLNTFELFYDSIKNILNKKINTLYTDKKEITPFSLLNLFTLNRDEITLEQHLLDPLLSAFSFKLGKDGNKNFSTIGDFNVLLSRPIIQLEDEKLFFPSLFSLSEAMYESPYYWMLDDKTYLNKALHNRGNVAEDITLKLIKKIFKEENAAKTILIKKNKKTTVSDIDILAYHEEKAIIFQIKTKKLVSSSKKGNIESIKRDFKLAVSDAYKQGLVCANCILNKQDYLFEYKENGVFQFPQKIDKCYIVTISLDYFPSLSFISHILVDKEESFPISLSIFDLEVLCDELKTPKKFIDYLEARLNYSKNSFMTDELSFLKAFQSGFFSDLSKNTLVALDASLAQSFDKEYYGEISGINNIERMLSKKIGRNEPCPCGSNKKYKKCHGRNY